MTEVVQAEPHAVSPDMRVWRTELHVPRSDAMTVIDPPPIQRLVPSLPGRRCAMPQTAA